LKGVRNVRDAKSLAAVGAALAVALFFSPSCSPDSGSEVGIARLDLIRLHEEARRFRETGAVNIRSFDRYYHLARGWSFPHADGEGGPLVVAAIAGESVLRYGVVRPATRFLAFSVRTSGPLGGPARQRVEVYAGPRLVGSFDVEGELWRRERVRIPDRVQRFGDNEIAFRFAGLAENPNFLADEASHAENPYPGVAAYFRDFEISTFRGSRSLSGEELRAFVPAAGGRRLIQRANSAISFAFEVEPGSRLLLRGELNTPPRRRGEVTLAVSAHSDARPAWADLWSRRVEIGGGESVFPFSAEIPLELPASRPVEIMLILQTTSHTAGVRVAWDRMLLERPETAPVVPEAVERQPVRISEEVGGVRNVVFVILDAARPDGFGCYGCDEGLTPNIDALAESSLVFCDAVAPASYTLASCASLFSGLLPPTHGVSYSINREYAPYPEEMDNMVRAFKRKGFYTLIMTGNHFVSENFGFTRGRDRQVNLRSAVSTDAYLSTVELERMERGVSAAAESGVPAFIYVHLLPPHKPYNPPDDFEGRRTSGRLTPMDSIRVTALASNPLIGPDHPEIAAYREHYDDNLAYADHVVGLLFEMLRHYGLYDDSLIIVTADHGEAFGEHGHMEHNTTVYDEMIKIPLIVHAPGLEPGEVSQHVGLIDFFPTFVELFDLDVYTLPFQGRSLAPFFAGREPEPTDYYFSINSGHKQAFTLRGDRYKYVHHIHREELYDLVEDPGETVNIIAEHPVLAACLRQRGMALIYLAPSSEELRQMDEEDVNRLRDIGYLQ